MGAAIIALILSPWGKESGAHFNPAVTFTFYRLGRVEPWDAFFYVVAQFSGAMSGVAIATYVLQGAPANQAIRYAVTVPGVYGMVGAFIGEMTISFVLMTTVLFVTFETPLSGMSGGGGQKY
jgi:aquaporin Z